MNKILKILGPRLLGGVASMVSGWIYTKTRGVVTVDPVQAVDAVELIGGRVVELVGTMVTTYGVTHRAASAKVNPGDTASRRMVVAVADAVRTGSAVIPEPKRD